ncbi:hypothetical protein Pla110_46450 [Polystyrenella longa]|uniref:Uncharacterized protein n=1 Tax=Polystyrenella longa TaxID=2528007 RepID=A0A518CUI4_9PLAN|nr:rod shape-determining protein MreD [Polystyrenella longa]QDU82882.1 hypothetical protein Pla110_46450 [Polystyrenella longa]
MKTTFKLFLLLYVALVCQAGLTGELTVWSMSPSFLAMLMVGLTAATSGNRAYFLAAMVGLADDALRGETMGLGMFVAVLGLWISQWKAEEKKGETAYGRSFFLLSWYVAGVNLSVTLLDGQLKWWQSVVTQSVGSIFYTAAMLVTLVLMQRLVKRFWSGSSSKVAWR